MRKTALILLSMLLVMSAFCGCGGEKDGADGEFYAVISSNPQNLDPQMATDKQSMFVIKNTYALLMDTDADGGIISGAAKSYSVSDDGLKYTFNLRDDLSWYGVTGKNPIALTSYDYQFAFRRIFDSETHSPYTKQFGCIKNSSAVLSGEKKPTELGVRAPDHRTLEIELDHPDCDFLKLLTHTASAPCNKELFLSTQGRYGLSAADTFSCGAFYISDWNYDPYWTDNHITLERINSNSHEDFRTFPQIVNIIITDDRADCEKQKNFKTDAYIVKNISRYDKDVKKSYKCKEYISSTTLLFMNRDFMPFSDMAARRSLFGAVNCDNYADELSDDSVMAYDIIPEAITVMSKSYRDFFSAAERRFPFSAGGWESLVNEHPEVDLNSSIMLVSDELNSQTLPYSIISDFEERLNFYCTPVFKNESEFRQSVKNGEYQLMIDTVRSDSNLCDEFLKNVYSLSGCRDEEYDKLLRRILRCTDINEKKDAVRKAEDYLIENCYVLPVSYEKEYLLYLEDDTDIRYDPYTETMLFKYAKKY